MSLTVAGLAQEVLQPADFNPGFDVGSGADNWVGNILPQKDGKIILTGAFTQFQGHPHNKVVRLNSNGSTDETYAARLTVDDSIWAAAQQTNGKLLIGGKFNKIGGVNQRWIARLDASGNIDSSFRPALDGLQHINSLSDYYVPITALAVQGDKILIGGTFTNVNGVARSGLARLNADGTLDESFGKAFVTLRIPSGQGVSITPSIINALAIQPDGKILAGGVMSVDGTNRLHFVRLNSDGTLDSDFSLKHQPGTREFNIYAIALQPDGKIIIGGDLVSINRTVFAIFGYRVAYKALRRSTALASVS